MLPVKEKTNLILGFHCYIPQEFQKSGFENEVVKANLALVIQLIDLLNEYKNIKIVLHLSGNLISCLDKKYSEFSGKIRELLEHNRLELLSGGMYEPIFPFIPKEDRHAQISLMNRLINHTYGYVPYGAWITEYSWEPNVALDLAKSRIQYTCLPKEYFENAGLDEKDLSGYFITEDEGRKIGVFPIQQNINTLIEQFSPEEAVNVLLKSPETTVSPEQLLLCVYDAGKHDSSKAVWLKTFLGILNTKLDSVETRLLNNYYQKNKPKGRIYLPGDIYSNSKKGKWKHSLLRYNEANLLHKKMLRVSKKVNAAKEGKSRFKVIKEMINKAYDLLLLGQCNDTFCDATTSGIYSSTKRHNTYSNLIKAENLIDQASRQSTKWIQAFEIDYDCDGNDEIIIETETQNIYISPALGGTILEHDYRPKCINITNTISDIERDRLDNKQACNTYGKVSLIDHFLKNDLNLDKCISNDLVHLTEKILHSYNVEKIKAKEETSKVAMDCKVNLSKLINNPEIELKKEISTKSGDSHMLIDYTLVNKSSDKIDFTFAIEFNFNITNGVDEKSYVFLNNNKESKSPSPGLDSPEFLSDLNQISIYSNHYKSVLGLAWNKPGTLFRYPIETSCNENSERTYQGTTLLATWHLILEPEIPWVLSIKQEISSVTEEL